MCICEEIGGQKLPKFPFIHTQSSFRCFYALNFRQTATHIEISTVLPMCVQKKTKDGLRHPRTMRLETLFRSLLDAPDRGISLNQIVEFIPVVVNTPGRYIRTFFTSEESDQFRFLHGACLIG